MKKALIILFAFIFTNIFSQDFILTEIEYKSKQDLSKLAALYFAQGYEDYDSYYDNYGYESNTTSASKKEEDNSIFSDSRVIFLLTCLGIWLLSKFKTYLNKYPTLTKLLNESGDILLDGLIIVMFIMFILAILGVLFMIYMFFIKPYV